MKDLLRKHGGSFRKVAEAYWLNRLSLEEERILEDFVPKDTLIGYKPCQITANDSEEIASCLS